MLLSWANYNSKNSKPNKSTSLFGRRTEDFQQLTCLNHSALLNNIAEPYTHCSPRRNPFHTRENKLAEGVAATNDSATPLHISAVFHTPTPTVAPTSAAPMTRYTDKDLQKTALLASQAALNTFV